MDTTHMEIHTDLTDEQLMTRGYYKLLLTTEFSTKLLSRNKSNRRQRPTQVNYLYGLMACGKWQPEHPDSLATDDQGLLRNGQHRVRAQIKYNKPILTYVKTGIPAEVFRYVDDGVKRKLEDKVLFDDDHETNHHISQMLEFWIGLVAKSSKKVVATDAFVFFEEHKESILSTVKYAKLKIKAICRKPISVALCEFYEFYSKEKALEFAESFYYPDGGIQPARWFRDWCLRTLNKKYKGGGGGVNRDIYERAIYCMIAHKDGRVIDQVRKANWQVS